MRDMPLGISPRWIHSVRIYSRTKTALPSPCPTPGLSQLPERPKQALVQLPAWPRAYNAIVVTRCHFQGKRGQLWPLLRLQDLAVCR